MNPETLDPLLLDRALGELPPPVAALLDEHLARDPAAAQRAAGLVETLQLARQSAAKRFQGEPRPVPDVDWLRRAAGQVRWRSNFFGLAKLAACVALGLVLGRTTGPDNPAPAPSGPVAIGTVPADTASPVPETKFWSVARQVAEQRSGSVRSSRHGRDDDLLWTAPFKMPRMEENP